MFDNRLLLTIKLNKKKLKKCEKGSCTIEVIPTIKLLNEEEFKELKHCINRATELLKFRHKTPTFRYGDTVRRFNYIKHM